MTAAHTFNVQIETLLRTITLSNSIKKLHLKIKIIYQKHRLIFLTENSTLLLLKNRFEKLLLFRAK